MIFRQLFDSKSSTFTYLLADAETKEAVLIDPVIEKVNRDLALINELGLDLKYAIDTHCHADHVTGAWLLKQRVGCKILCSKEIGAENVDVELRHGDIINFGDCQLQVRATPGHTDGCLTFVNEDSRMAFTGDALLIRGCGRCDFQQGNAGVLFDSIKEQILTLADDYKLYPGHDYSGRCETSVAEEKEFNARLGGQANKTDFVSYMDNMSLPHPKFIDIALPANLQAGKPEIEPEQATWAPIEFTYAGFYQIEPEWVALNLDSVTVLDVREDTEVEGGRIVNSLNIPIGELEKNIVKVPKDKPVITFCRSGKRSALAINMLVKAGFTEVANLRGGYINWQELGLPIAQ